MNEFLENSDQNNAPQAEFASAKTKSQPSDKEGQLTIDVYREGNEIIVKSAIGGVSSKDIDISVTKDMVIIKGERRNEKSVKQSDYYYRELHWGKFSRTIILPLDVDPDKAKASIKNGILMVRLPILEEIKSKKLSVT